MHVATLPEGITWTTRLAANAALSGPPPAPNGKRGRPRKKDDSLGTLTQIAARLTFRPVTVHRYGQKADIHIGEQILQWYGPSKDLMVRLILLRDTALGHVVLDHPHQASGLGARHNRSAPVPAAWPQASKE